MKVKIYDLNKKAVGDASLDKEVFGLEARPDIIKRVVDWQLAKAQAGTHSSKNISEVSGTTKKPFRQKGTGNARQGSLRSVQMRGGAIAHGPRVRSHEHSLPKKIRQLGMRHALSAKAADGKIIILSKLEMKNAKTAEFTKNIKAFGDSSFLIIDGDKVNENAKKASSNMHNISLLPQIGANVYDIIKYDYLMLTQDAVTALEKRLKNA